MGAGWNLYSMSRINDYYIGEFARDMDLFYDKINNGPGLYAEFGFYLTPEISAGIGLAYLYGCTKKVDGDWKRSLTTTMYAPEIKIRYHFSKNHPGYFMGGGLAWCFGKAVLDSKNAPAPWMDSDHYEPDAQGFGLAIFTGYDWALNETFSIGTELGYRYYTTGDLEENGETWILEYSGSSHKMNLSFSGPFISANLSIKL
jgi:hypothetical protein